MERISIVGATDVKFSARARDAEVLSSSEDMTGHVKWRATECLAQWLARRRDWLRGKHVVELGCGTGLAGVCATQFARLVVFTDRDEAVLPFAAANAVANGAVLVDKPPARAPEDGTSAAHGGGAGAGAGAGGVKAGGGAGAEAAAYAPGTGAGTTTDTVAGDGRAGSSASPPTVPRTSSDAHWTGVAALEWGLQDADVRERWGRFDLAVAGEVLYIFRASDTSVFESAVQLFRTAAFLLNGDGDDTRCACGGEDAAKRDGAGCAGVLCFVYTPRYRGMGPAIRRAAAECGLAFRTVNRYSVLNDDQVASMMFGRVRLASVSACPVALAAFVGDAEVGGASDDDSGAEIDEDSDGDPLAAVGVADDE